MAAQEHSVLDLTLLSERLRVFASDREWDQFHTPKNLASALVVEAGELLENFQWLTAEESRRLVDKPAALETVERELADVIIYAVRLADVLKIDVPDVVESKLKSNEAKYPVEKSKGVSTKYTGL